MKLTRRALLGKLPFGIAGAWAMLRGRKPQEKVCQWEDGADGKHATGFLIREEPQLELVSGREYTTTDGNEEWQSVDVVCHPYLLNLAKTGFVYYCLPSGGDEDSDGLDPDNPTTFAKAIRLAQSYNADMVYVI